MDKKKKKIDFFRKAYKALGSSHPEIMKEVSETISSDSQYPQAYSILLKRIHEFEEKEKAKNAARSILEGK